MEDGQELKYVVSMKPGSAAEQAYRFELPVEKLDNRLEEIITYGLGLNTGRRNERIAQTIRIEMRDKYGLTVNGNAAKKDTVVRDYFTERQLETEGKIYRGMDIIVAAQQTGGLEETVYDR